MSVSRAVSFPKQMSLNADSHRTVGTPLRDFRRFHEFKGLVIAWQVCASVTDMLLTVVLVNDLVRNSQHLNRYPKTKPVYASNNSGSAKLAFRLPTTCSTASIDVS